MAYRSFDTPLGPCTDLHGTPYPCTVVPARYGGCYEGGAWLAFPARPDRMPEEWDGGDVECRAFYLDRADWPIGRGEDATEAVDDLLRRLHAPTPEATDE